MIDGLGPYPAMMESGVPWLGAVPSHWHLRRMKTLLRERLQKGFPNEPLLAATQSKGVVRKDRYESRTVLALKDLHLLKLVRVGDFVISLRSFQGGIEYARDEGIISPAYTVLYCVDPNSHGYVAHLFKSTPFVEGLTLHVTGIRQGQNVDYEKLSRTELPVPPSDEQAAIVRFLNHADRRIRRFMRAKQNLIALLEEQKQVIINRAVTRGLDRNVRLKPSGVEWLEKVPEHWEVQRLKALVTEAVAGPYGSSLTKAMYTSDGYRVYGQQQVIPDNFSTGDYFISPAMYEQMKQYRVRPGDVLVSVMGTVGRVAVVPEDVQPGIINPRLVRYRPDFSRIRPRYLQLAMQSPPSRAQIVEGSKGTTMEGLNMQILGRLRISLPPLHEQDAILGAIASDTSVVERALDDALRKILLLREYRTRLIADVVTGKLDVRKAAARLPDELDEPEWIDAADGEFDPDEPADELRAEPAEATV